MLIEILSKQGEGRQMCTKNLRVLVANLIWLGATMGNAANASDLLPGLTYNVTCYQNGTAILKTQNRIREFTPSEAMKLLVDINLGQVTETHVRVYASTVGDVTCVLTRQR